MGNASTGVFNFCSIQCAEIDDANTFDDYYQVDERNYIGTGKFSVVHLCWNRFWPEKRCAMKVIDTRNTDSAGLSRVREEIKVLRVLGRNRYITSLLDFDESSPHRFRLVMELCEGGELYDRIQQRKFYPETEARTCLHNLLEGVVYVHSKGIMHRDLKPENILLTNKVSHTDIKITDFGLAKMSRNFPEKLPRATSICGSDFYLAPEVIRQEEYGREIDIWAVGVIAYVIFSGSLPFFHDVLHKLYRRIVERDLTFVEDAWRQVSKGGMDFVIRMLQVRPGERPTSVSCLNHPWIRTSPSTSTTTEFRFDSLCDGRRSPDSSSSLESLLSDSHCSDRRRSRPAVLNSPSHLQQRFLSKCSHRQLYA